MNKQHTIELIRKHNLSANADFLTRFDEQSLEIYLRRLSTINNHRGRGSRWVRDTTSPAVTTRIAAPRHHRPAA